MYIEKMLNMCLKMLILYLNNIICILGKCIRYEKCTICMKELDIKNISSQKRFIMYLKNARVYKQCF